MTKLAKEAYKGNVKPIWCPGCGDFGVLTSLYMAMAELELDPKKVVVVSGIGCSGRLPAFVKDYGFHGVHGRALPIAQGVKLARPELTVIVVGGDGDGFGIGGGHLPHAARRNVDLTYIVLDNNTYGLTKGQTSPTSVVGYQTGSTPYGNVEEPLNPIALTLAHDASFVARGYSAQAKHMTELIMEAVQHRGFSFIQALSPCVTFNHRETFKFYASLVQPIPVEHDPTNKLKAFELAYNHEKVWLGVFYQVKKAPWDEKI
ncbi:MAG: 2-oxoacid:ferredoxin oxidoreductase subunit beta, partial [Deltaproteobacteria bacterium]|nr:2-oxoacid:ferredoxin oxidoreductase subunit beta [Deltaproteobacteria bacterium]